MAGDVRVADVESVVAAAQEHGGSLLGPATDVGPLGRMTVLADPAGAASTVMAVGPARPTPDRSG